MGTLKIGSASNRAGVTIEPRTVLFNGNNVNAIKSGVTEIWSYAKALVPTMTSNTTPYGEVIYKNYANELNLPYMAFDKNIETAWSGAKNDVTNQYIGYKFTTPVCVQKVNFSHHGKRVGTLVVQASNDNNDWLTISDTYKCQDENNTRYNIELKCNTENKYYLYYRLLILTTTATDYSSIHELQFYGTQSEALIPTMTSNSQDGYNAISSNTYGAFHNYLAFDNNSSTRNVSTGRNGLYWIGIELPSAKKVNTIVFSFGSTDLRKGTFVLQGSNDGFANDINDIATINGVVSATTQAFDVMNNTPYKYYRCCTSDATHYGTEGYISFTSLQFYE